MHGAILLRALMLGVVLGLRLLLTLAEALTSRLDPSPRLMNLVGHLKLEMGHLAVPRWTHFLQLWLETHQVRKMGLLFVLGLIPPPLHRRVISPLPRAVQRLVLSRRLVRPRVFCLTPAALTNLVLCSRSTEVGRWGLSCLQSLVVLQRDPLQVGTS